MLVIEGGSKLQWCVETSGGSAIVIQALLGGYLPADFPTPAGWTSPFASHLDEKAPEGVKSSP